MPLNKTAYSVFNSILLVLLLGLGALLLVQPNIPYRETIEIILLVCILIVGVVRFIWMRVKR